MKTIKLKNNIKITDFLDNLEVLGNYDLSYLQIAEIVNQCINKFKFEDDTKLKCVSFDVNKAIFDIIDKAFKIGYLHGYKHHKDNGNKIMTDNTFKQPKVIDINNQLQDFIKNGFYPKY